MMISDSFSFAFLLQYAVLNICGSFSFPCLKRGICPWWGWLCTPWRQQYYWLSPSIEGFAFITYNCFHCYVNLKVYLLVVWNLIWQFNLLRKVKSSNVWKKLRGIVRRSYLGFLMRMNFLEVAKVEELQRRSWSAVYLVMMRVYIFLTHWKFLLL